MTTLVLLHGIPGSATTWQAAAQRLQGHRVLVPDLLGFGSQRPPCRSDALLAASQADHILSFMDRADVGEAVVVGHDFGGPVAAHLYAAAPERVAALALFATNAFPDTPIPFPLSMLNVPVAGAVIERLLFSRSSLAFMVRQGVGRPRADLDLRSYIGGAEQRSAIATIFAASLRRLDELYAPVAATLAKVDVPALVGWGDRDPFFPVAVGERTAGLIPGARLRIYEGAGHFLPEERPDEIATDLLLLVSELCAS